MDPVLSSCSGAMANNAFHATWIVVLSAGVGGMFAVNRSGQGHCWDEVHCTPEPGAKRDVCAAAVVGIDVGVAAYAADVAADTGDDDNAPAAVAAADKDTAVRAAASCTRLDRETWWSRERTRTRPRRESAGQRHGLATSSIESHSTLGKRRWCRS